MDWTVLTAAGEPRLGLRGVDGSLEDVTTLIEGYSPDSAAGHPGGR
ncbi:MAG: hypothetical protein R2838_08940 [Caldilineaceae bacterium]